ncbi:hypothetical protein IE53DRAFT_258536 [Violaceomyces palustris]|uniref:Uncharacterized protein n=1 Tax=Violaceomyces palustris TaxID=1673888 RepID=A0ACD0P7X4_9BASI|nr:hypothetical protein IE53DRAFT_258536 [Violaceomyces palustris]
MTLTSRRGGRGRREKKERRTSPARQTQVVSPDSHTHTHTHKNTLPLPHPNTQRVVVDGYPLLSHAVTTRASLASQGRVTRRTSSPLFPFRVMPSFSSFFMFLIAMNESPFDRTPPFQLSKRWIRLILTMVVFAPTFLQGLIRVWLVPPSFHPLLPSLTLSSSSLASPSAVRLPTVILRGVFRVESKSELEKKKLPA